MMAGEDKEDVEKGSSLPKLVSFQVQIVSRYRKKNRRFLVIDTENGTISRSNVDEETEDMEETGLELRKTITISTSFMLLPSEVNKRKLRFFVGPHSKPVEVLFESAAAREQFSTIVRTLRSVSTMAEMDRSSRASEGSIGSGGRRRFGSMMSTVSTAPPRLGVFCTTFNVSKQAAPGVCKSSRTNGSHTSDPSREDSEHITDGALSEAGSLESPSIGSEASLSLVDLYEWLPPDEFDLYFIALQECRSKHYPDWQQLILNTLNRKFEFPTNPATYRILASTSMWGIHSLLVVREKLFKHFSHVHCDSRACGLGGVMGNKGAVGISVRYGEGTSASETSFAFVNSHLAARAERLPHRAQNYAEICHSLLARRKKGNLQGVQLLHAYDHIFWAGDLNYRNDMGGHGSPEEFSNVINIVRESKLHLLAPHDQLSQERAKHNVFIGFREGELKFAPTYRLEHGKFSEYNNKRNQNPSWTDRVLWRSLPGGTAHVELTDYYCSESMVYSDHRPVCGCFSVLTSCAVQGSELEELESKMESALISARRTATMKREASRASKLGASARSLGTRPPTLSAKTLIEQPSLDPDEVEDQQGEKQVRLVINKLQFFCRFLDEKQEAALDLLDHESTALKDDEEIVDSDGDDAEEIRNGPFNGQETHSQEEQRTIFSFAQWYEEERGTAQLTQRRNSFRRPVNSLDLSRFVSGITTPSKKPASSSVVPPFKGKGFSGGIGSLHDQGIGFCEEESSEFSRYVLRGNSGMHNPNSKVWIKLHGSFFEGTPQSSTTVGKEILQGSSSPISSSYFKYEWDKAMLPVVHPFLDDPTLLCDKQIVVSIHRPAPHLSGAFRQGQVIGQAHIPIMDISVSDRAWFAVPVLFNGLPAGILKGELENPAFAAEKRQREGTAAVPTNTRHSALRSSKSFLRTFCSTPNDSIDEEEEGEGEDVEVEEEEEEEEADELDQQMFGSRPVEQNLFVAAPLEAFMDDGDAVNNNNIFDGEDEATPPARRPSRPLSWNGADSSSSDGVVSTSSSQGKRLSRLFKRTSQRQSMKKRSETSSTTILQFTSSANSMPPQVLESLTTKGDKEKATEAKQDSAHGAVEAQTTHSLLRQSFTGSAWLSRALGFSSSPPPNPGKVIAYEDLIKRRFSMGVDQSRLESYLSDEEFARVFGISKEAFYSLPKWKRIERKKAVQLF